MLPLFTHFGVAVRGKPTLEMLALVIPYSEYIIREAMKLLFGLRAFRKINVNFVALFCITPFGVAVRGKASLQIACIGHSVLGEPQGTI